MEKQRPDVALVVCWSLIAILLLLSAVFLVFNLTRVGSTVSSESPSLASSISPSPASSPAPASTSPSSGVPSYGSKAFHFIPAVAEHTIVYVTTYGDHYHRSGCSHLFDHKSTSCTLKEAISEGYTPCSNYFD